MGDVYGAMELPSRELTYPHLGKSKKISSKKGLGVLDFLSFQEGSCFSEIDAPLFSPLWASFSRGQKCQHLQYHQVLVYALLDCKGVFMNATVQQFPKK